MNEELTKKSGEKFSSTYLILHSWSVKYHNRIRYVSIPTYLMHIFLTKYGLSNYKVILNVDQMRKTKRKIWINISITIWCWAMFAFANGFEFKILLIEISIIRISMRDWTLGTNKGFLHYLSEHQYQSRVGNLITTDYTVAPSFSLVHSILFRLMWLWYHSHL